MLLRRSRSGVIIEVSPFRVLMARVARFGGDGTHLDHVRELPAEDWKGVERELRALFPEHKGYVPGVCGVFSPTRLLQREELNPRKLADPAYLAGLLAEQHKIILNK